MNYGKAIRTARSIADRSQEDVAKAASINRSYLSSIEAGHRIPSIKTLESLTRVLEIPMHLLQLLGMEKRDFSSNQEEHVKSLAIELTKLLLQRREDEPGKYSTPAGDAKSVGDKESSRSGNATRHRQEGAGKIVRRNSGPLRAISSRKKEEAIPAPKRRKKENTTNR